jgi:hypothetical protein
MVLTIEDHPSALLELLWVREAWGLHPVGTDLPPRLADGPRSEIDRPAGDRPDLDQLEVDTWSSRWPELWSACLTHTAAGPDRTAIERLQGPIPEQREREALLAAVIGPSWHDGIGDAALTERYREWDSAFVDALQVPRPFGEDPERLSLHALVPAWRAGLTRVVLLPCEGSFTRRVGPSALVVTVETREDPARYASALRSFH